MNKQVKKEKKIFLEHLPHSKSGKQVLWRKCEGLGFDFIYDNIQGHIVIESVKNNYLTLLYKNKTITITTSQLLQMGFCKLIGLYNNEYLYNVGDEVNSLLILEQIKLKSGKDDVKAYKYKCLIDGNIDTIREYDLDRKGHGCNVCSNHKCMKGINDIATTHSHLVKYFANVEDAYTHTYGSHDEILFICPVCGYKRKMKIEIFKRNGITCPKCSDGISYPNKFGWQLLKYLLGDFEREYSPDWIKPRAYDFYFKLNDKEYMLEMDGGLGHGKKSYGKSKLTAEESKAIDDYKDEQALLHGIEVVRIDCDYGYNTSIRFEYIKQNILNNKQFNMLFDLNNINWENIYENTLNSKVKEACDLWNSGIHSTKEIGEIMKMSGSTICSYLKLGNKLNWISYNAKSQQCKTNEEHMDYIHNIVKKQVMCLTTGKIFESIKDASDFYNCSSSGISKCCKGKSKHCGILKDGTKLQWGIYKN